MAPEPHPATDRHRHRWTGVDFYVDADRPMMRRTCACGAERRIRAAFDRSWQPPATHQDGYQ
jgi:hypothetical protein